MTFIFGDTRPDPNVRPNFNLEMTKKGDFAVTYFRSGICHSTTSAEQLRVLNPKNFESIAQAILKDVVPFDSVVLITEEASDAIAKIAQPQLCH